MLAMRFALLAPPRVAGLALVDTSAAAEEPRKRLQYRALVALHRAVGMPRALFAWRVARLMFGDRTLRARKDLVDRSFARTMGFDREGVARAAEAVVIHRSDVTAQLGRIDVPTLVLVGREDRATPPARAEEIARGIPGASLTVLDDVGHMAVVEDPALVNAELVPWVRARVG
jgi:3-oxoadipate enol-lactonase